MSVWNKLRIRLEQIIDDLRALPLAEYPLTVQGELLKVIHAIMWVSRSYPDELGVEIFIEDALDRIEDMLCVAWDVAALCGNSKDLPGKIEQIKNDFCEAEDAYQEGWREKSV